jgi:hypothetical protein
MGRKKTTARLDELKGAPPRLASSEDLEAVTQRGGYTHARRISSGLRNPLKINLMAVSEALAEEGLDPAVEFARILRGKPLVDENGNPVMDPITGEQARRYEIDADVRVRMLNQILEYTQPKLKAVEVKMSGNLELNSEQLDQRLNALLQKAVR